MKNKKGFTLIELLAVIVILAIIALIAIPIVLNMINNARKKAAESSAYGFVEAIEYNNGLADVSDDMGISYERVTGTNLDVTTINVKMKGKRPTSGTVTIDETGKVTTGDFCIEGYQVAYRGKEVTEVKKGCGNTSSSSEPSTPTSTPHKPVVDTSDVNSTASVKQLGLKGVTYLNPKDLTEECNASNSVSTTGTKTGCMKWYVFDDSGDTYKMILDHNTTAQVAYNETGNYVEYEQASIKTQLESDTAEWQGNPRLITAEEVATITNTSTYNKNNNESWFYFNGTGTNKQTMKSHSKGDNEYAWLYDYVNICESYGCNVEDSSTYGYWTSTSVPEKPDSAWRIDMVGLVNYGNVGMVYHGIRPVITLSKSLFVY